MKSISPKDKLLEVRLRGMRLRGKRNALALHFIYQLLDSYATQKIIHDVELLFRRNIALYSVYQKIAFKRVISNTANICIDAIPRAGNTFSYLLITNLDPGLEVIHRAHASAMVKIMLNFKIPVVILIRDPIDVITSKYIRNISMNKKISIENLIVEYEQYYETVLKHIDNVHVIDFNKLITFPVKYLEFLCGILKISNKRDMAQIIKNASKMAKNRITDHNVYSVETPTKERNILKKIIRERIEDNRYDLKKAYYLYNQICPQSAI